MNEDKIHNKLAKETNGEKSVTLDIDGRIAFLVKDNEVMSFEATGDIFVRGEKVDSNQAVYEEFRTWLDRATQNKE